MPIEAILLGLASAFRPTGIAAIYALLGSRSPRRSLLIFLVAGFAFSVTVGVLVVLALHNVTGFRRDAISGAIVDIVLGAAALGFAAGVWWQHIAWGSGSAAPSTPAWIGRLHDPST
ncbi:MAG: GAP family protein, partial [Baekduiaceae bacterium]